MCLQNDISVTSSDAYIWSNIYLFIVVITHVMHIQTIYPAGAKNNLGVAYRSQRVYRKNQCRSLPQQSLLLAKHKIEIIYISANFS